MAIDQKCFIKSMAIIQQAFPKFEFNARLYYEVLQDLDGECLVEACMEICKTLEEIYPGTNLLALIRQRTLNLKKQKILNTRKITDETCDPPPQEWSDLLKKMKAGKS